MTRQRDDAPKEALFRTTEFRTSNLSVGGLSSGSSFTRNGPLNRAPLNRERVARWSIGKRAALASTFALSLTLIGLYDLQPKAPTDNPLSELTPTTSLGESETAVTDTPMEAPATPSVRPEPEQRTHRIDRGDTLMTVLAKLGVEAEEAHAAVRAIKPHFNPRDLRVGQTLTAEFQPDAKTQTQTGGDRLVQLALRQGVERTIVASLSDEGTYIGREELTPLSKTPVRRAGNINSSLYEAMVAQGVPDRIIIELIRIMSYDVDFQRDIHKGNRFDVLYEVMTDETGRPIKSGNVLFGSLTTNKKTIALYRHEMAGGKVGFYTADGKSSKKLLMRTPIDGARISSGYGMRRHPVLGYSKMHKGVDFAAPRGTPIMAAGNGKIDYAGRRGSFGIYVQLQHEGGYQTAYAHMKNLAKGISKGRRVRQGQIIGYVGTTGRSTGPHLHYE
ncbi:MAG: M23 family metallopeptidase, partial [Alphaproteobacteria bacterium]